MSDPMLLELVGGSTKSFLEKQALLLAEAIGVDLCQLAAITSRLSCDYRDSGTTYYFDARPVLWVGSATAIPAPRKAPGDAFTMTFETPYQFL